MVRFGIVGTGRISDWVLKGAPQDPRIKVTAVCSRMVEAARKSGRLLMEAMISTLNPNFQAVAARVDEIAPIHILLRIQGVCRPARARKKRISQQFFADIVGCSGDY
ncbi:MAG: hypothetical protein IKW11_03970 [Bacteroidales bacterium]|nr:hypothetical protein [Bacteroidales bacterium]